MNPPMMKRLRRIGCAIMFGAAALPAMAAQDALDQEIRHFLNQSTASEMQALHKKMMVQTALNMGARLRPEYVTCIYRDMDARVFDEASLALARKNFTDLERLKGINEFVRSAAGKKHAQNAVNAMQSGLKQLLAGEQIAPPRPAPFSTDEMRVIQAFGASPSYAPYLQFSNDLLAQLEVNDANNKQVQAVENRCRAEEARLLGLPEGGPTNKRP